MAVGRSNPRCHGGAEGPGQGDLPRPGDPTVSPSVHPGPGHGTLLLAGISGYTAFLQAVAQAHAADLAAGTFVPEAYPLLTSLLDGIVERLAPPFVLSEIEGDAVFAVAADDQLELRGPSILACLAGCYEAYRARLEAARDLMICTCDACSSIGGLELKFVMHHGDYVVQSTARQSTRTMNSTTM